MSTMSTTKPTLTFHAPYAQITSLRTNLSFLLPTSLSAFPSLSWLQTPWFPSFAALSSAHISAISSHFSLPPSVLQNALPFGSTPGHGPDLFILFPNLTGEKGVVTNEKFLKLWHDEIVKPAFDRAWQDSAQTRLTGAFLDAFVHILPATGVRTDMDAHPFSGFSSRLRKGTPGHVSVAWPAGNPKVLDAAWDAIKGMLKGHPDLGEYQDPMLVAVQRDEVWFGEQVGARGVYEGMGKEWERWVDGELVREGSLRVVLEVVVGVERGEEKKAASLGTGREFKRMVEDEEVEVEKAGVDGREDDGGHRAKRRRVEEQSEDVRDAGD